MKYLVSVLVLLIGYGVYAQTAKVITISTEDAKLARTTWQEKVDADKAWDDLVLRIQKRYVGDPATNGTIYFTGNTTYVVAQGWENGIEFSSDFKSIVPRPVPSGRGNTPCYQFSTWPSNIDPGIYATPVPATLTPSLNIRSTSTTNGTTKTPADLGK